MTAPTPRSLVGTFLAVFGGLAPSDAQVEVWHIGKGGLSWVSQAETQIGALDVDGALQPLQLKAGENLIELLGASGQRFLNGQPRDFTLGGQPRAWSNDGFFNQINGPLALIDGDPQTSSAGVFKTAQSQAGATFFWDLGAPFPVTRIRFFPAPGDDAFVKAFELLVNDGENFNDINRPQYAPLRRVEVNREATVDIEFAPLQGRFLQLLVLSKTAFNIAEFEIYGQGFVPVASYESALHSFGGPVNYGRLRVHATHLGATAAATAAIQLRTGADDSPLTHFRRDRDTGRQEEVTEAEYNTRLPRRTLFRQDAATGELLEELDRADYLTLPVEEQGPVRDFVKGDIRDDVDNWSAWSPSIHIAGTGVVEVPIGLPSPREFMQFRIFFDGDAENAVRIDTFQVEFSPGLVREAVGEVALATDPFPASGLLEVAGGIDTTFTYDIRTEFAAGVAGYRGVRIEAFPPPVFESLKMGDPLAAVADFAWDATERGFEVFFAPVAADNNQPLRITFRLRLLEHNTPIRAYLLGAGNVPPHPIAPGNASELVGTDAAHAFATKAQPELQLALSTAIISPNGDGRNDAVAIDFALSQFAADTAVAVEVFDLSGRRVRQLVSESRPAGFYSEIWHGRDEQGGLVAPGLYLCRVGVEADFAAFAAVEPIGVAY